MNNAMRTLTLILGVYFSVSFLASAQPETRSLKFKIYTGYDGSNGANKYVGELYFTQGGKMRLIELNPSSVSKERKATVKDKFTLYRKQMGDDGNYSYLPVVSTPIPKSLKHAFIYYFPSDKHKKLLAIDTSLQAFPKGRVLFLNESEKIIGVQINDRAKLIKRKKRAHIPYSPTSKGTLRIRVKDYSHRKQKSHPNLSVMTVGALKNQRVIAFFYQLEGGQHRLLLERGVDDQSIQITPKP